MFRRLARGKDSSPAKAASQTQPKKEQKSQDAEGFLCPMCMARLPGPAELQSHFEKAHSEGGVGSNENASLSTEENTSQVDEKLIDIDDDDDDETDIGQKSKLQIEASGDSQEEVILLQQELKELTTAIKEEKWYTGQLKDELDKVTTERNKLEEEREMFQQEYDSKLRSAEDSYLQVAQENEKLRDEVRYADIKSLKERDTKLNSEIDSLKMDLSQEKEMRAAVEEANKHMMEQIERKDKALDDLKFQLNARPTSDNVSVLENEIQSLKVQIQTLEKETEKNSRVETDKYKQTIDELKNEIAKQQLMIKELNIEKTSKIEQADSIQNALKAALETNKQAQQQTQEKKQQIIDLQHETREAQATVKEKTAFIAHLEKQLQESKTSTEQEMKEKQSLQQQIRSLENAIDAGSITSNEKDSKLQEMETLLAKEKAENQRLENERSDLVAKIEAGAGVETAINQLRQEKEKLIESIAKLEEEVAAQSKKHSSHLNELRDDKAKLKDELESLKNDKYTLEKKLKGSEEEVNMKLQLIEQLKTNLHEKTNEVYRQESDRSSEKISFEKEISDIKSSLQSKSNETVALEQKVSKISSDLSNATSSKLEIEEQLLKQREENTLLEDKLQNLTKEISDTAKLLTSVQEELVKEKSDRRKDSDDSQMKLKELAEESDRKDKNIQELNEELSAKNSDITLLREQADEHTKRLNMMSAEFVTFRNNEALLNTTIQNLELEFGNQKNALTLHMETLISKGKETEAKFESEIGNKQKELDTLRSSSEEEMKQLREKFAEKELEYQEKLKEKDGELYFITESSKETVSGYEKSVALLEGALKDGKENGVKLENEISKLQGEKLVLAESLETKDTTLHDLQRKLEVAEAELKKKCESCKNYEIQLCRFQETHKEQILTVTKLEGEIEGLRKELKASSEKCASLDEEFQTLKNESSSREGNLKLELEQAKEVNSVLDARILELDDELKEAYNKMSVISEKITIQEEGERKLTEERAYLKNEIANLRIVEEDLKKEVEKEKQLADVKYQEIRMQKLDVESLLKEAENDINKEKDKAVQAKEAMVKMQNVMKEKMEAIGNKLVNIEKEKEEMKKSNEESEARLNMEIRSVKENLISSRNEVERGESRISALSSEISNMERDRENLRGDVAVMEVQIRNINDEKRALTERVLESEEAHKRTKDRLSETNRRLEQSLAALQELGQENQSIQMQQNFKMTRQWQDDSLVTNCKACDKLFSLTIRKHHCRHCGSIFCNECSNNYTQVAASKKPVRVCTPCFSELTSIRGRRVSAASMT